MNIVVRASSANRFTACFGSVVMESLVPEPPDSDAALEGTTAHELARMILTGEVGSAEEMIDRVIQSTGLVVDGEMAKHVQAYVDEVRSRPVDWLKCEAHVPFRIVSPVTGRHIQVEATTDCVAYSEAFGILWVDDLKYGYRLVEAPGNWQGICYMLGSVIQFLSGPQGQSVMESKQPITVVFTIHQPRPWHEDGPVRQWKLTGEELWDIWHAHLANVVVDKLHDSKDLCTGTHCHFCDAFAVCPSAQRAGMNSVDVAMQGVPQEIDGNALSIELENLDRAKRMIKQRYTAIENLAKQKIKNGEIVPNWGIEPNYGNSAWLNPDQLKLLEMVHGVDLHEKPKPVTPAEAKRRGLDEAIIKPLVDRPYIGHKLSRIDVDKAASKLFK